jgi:phosphoglycerol geranylgeranyltransferase
MKQGIRHLISANAKAGHKMVAWLIDPDSFDPESIFPLSEATDIDLIFVGGSLLSKGDLKTTVAIIKQKYPIPVVLFPGSIQQISSSADAILNLSLISGRNPEFLIGQHVLAAPMLKASGLEILPTGYILVDSGRQTTASYISGTTPVPHDKSDIAICTAMAGEMLGLQLIYLDGGSGAQKTISEQMISGVKKIFPFR